MKIAVIMPEGGIRDTFVTPAVRARLSEIGEISYNPLQRQYTEQELARVLADADVCLSGWGCPPFTRDALADAKKLALIAHTGGSVAPIVTPALFEKGVRIASGNLVYAESVAEGAIAYMLAALRRLPHYGKLVRDGGWREDDFENRGLLGRTVGLMGFGAIGRYLAEMLRAFRVTVLGYDPFADDAEFSRRGVSRISSPEELFRRSDILSVHLPATVQTYHVINAALLSLLPNGALLVNTARGSVIDEQALIHELETGRIGAALDVFEQEPLAADSPLRGMENVLAIPHMGGPTIDRRPAVTLALCEDIVRLSRGEPLVHEISRAYAMSMSNDAAVKKP